MSVSVRNTQRTIPLCTTVAQRQLQRIWKLTAERTRVVDDPSLWGLGLWLTNDTTVRRMNTIYRGVRRSTDVLSLPNYPVSAVVTRSIPP